ncbi:MAG: tRNA uracil 4-sulfurtransferase ThiI [Candidatus Micrarchaeaceae archaeon]
MNDEKVLLIHYGEVWLKGKNRPFYISKALENIEKRAKGKGLEIERQYDRIVVLGKEDRIEEYKKELNYVFGISHFETAYSIPSEKGAILRKIEELSKGFDSLRLEVNRSYRKHSFTSFEIYNEAKELLKKNGCALSRSSKNRIYVEITEKKAFLYYSKNKGPGGLPIGSSGNSVVCISGGIDSPVAAWYSMKRGLQPTYMHIYAFENARYVKESKMKRLFEIMKNYCDAKVFLVPSHIFLAAAIGTGPYETVLFKNFMLRVAQEIAKQEHVDSIVTGESLGQVASQTLKNLVAEEEGIEKIVIRPLIGFDKSEIIEKAKEIGTYKISIEPYPDACSISSKRAVTNADIERLKELIKKVNMDEIVERSIEKAEIIEF